MQDLNDNFGEMDEFSEAFRDQFNTVFVSEPENATPEAIDKWKELGPLTLNLVVNSGTQVQVDQSVKF